MTTTRARLLRSAIASLGAAALPALAACGTGAQPSGATAQPVELRLHGSSAGAEGEYWPKLVAQFNEHQTKAHATFEPWPPDQAGVPAVITLGTAGTLGDVMRLVAFSTYSQVAAKGFLKDLAPHVSRDKYDLKVFYPAAVETLKFRTKQYGLPHIAHPGFCGIYVNQDAMGAAGAREPDENAWALADLSAFTKQLSQQARSAGDQWGIFPPITVQHLTVAARAYGGNVLDKDGKRSVVAEPAAVQGIQFLADLILRDRAAPPPGTLQGNDQQNFIQGSVAAAWTNFGIINPLRRQAQGLRWKVLMAPKGPQGRGFFVGVDAASQNAQSKQPDQAFELCKFICAKAISLGWFDYGFAPGARQDTWNDPKIAADAAFKVFTRAMGEAAPLNLPDNGLITDYNNALTRELANLWTGKSSVRDATEAARRAGQEVLDRAA